MKVDTRIPGLLVTLKKNVARTTLDGKTPVSTRFAGQYPFVDLTPYIGENNGVRVSKSVREAAGSFSITLTDQLYYQGETCYGDSLYGLIEPMDSIEIRMTGNAYQSAAGPGAQPPMMMRGFVSRIELSEAMSADGKPQRQIAVSGQDYGKILQMMQVFHMPGIPNSDASYITAFPFFAQFGVGDNIMPADKFVSQLFSEVINPYIAKMRGDVSPAACSAPLQSITPDIQITGGQVSPYGNGGWMGGTIYSLIQSLGDIGPWNEFFIEDREDGPYAVYRPNPFLAVDGTPIFSFPTDKFPATTVIERADVVSISAVRTDAHVANYFWVESPRYNLSYEATLRMVAVQASQANPAGAATQGPYVTGYANVDPALYGQRKMTEQTHQGGNDETDNGNGTPSGTARINNQTAFESWITQRRIDLIAQNRDNIVFESGSMRLKGNESIKAGTYIQYQPGNVAGMYYVVAVEHDYTPFGSYFTTVQFERGTGFIGRVQQEAGSAAPYLAEMANN
jgi:hypothetical protein